MTNTWARTQDRKRTLIAAGTTAALYCLGFLLLLLIGLLLPSKPNTAEGPLVVDLGLPGCDGFRFPSVFPTRPCAPPARCRPRQHPRLPASSGYRALRSAPSRRARPESRGAGAESRALPRSWRPPKRERAPDPERIPGEAALPWRSAAAEFARIQLYAGQSLAGFGHGQSGRRRSRRGGGHRFRHFCRGIKEMGNELDTTFVAASGTFGRNLYAPILPFICLSPAQVDDSIYRAIPADSGGYYSADKRAQGGVRAFSRNRVRSGC